MVEKTVTGTETRMNNLDGNLLIKDKLLAKIRKTVFAYFRRHSDYLADNGTYP